MGLEPILALIHAIVPKRDDAPAKDNLCVSEIKTALPQSSQSLEVIK